MGAKLATEESINQEIEDAAIDAEMLENEKELNPYEIPFQATGTTLGRSTPSAKVEIDNHNSAYIRSKLSELYENVKNTDDSQDADAGKYANLEDTYDDTQLTPELAEWDNKLFTEYNFALRTRHEKSTSPK